MHGWLAYLVTLFSQLPSPVMTLPTLLPVVLIRQILSTSPPSRKTITSSRMFSLSQKQVHYHLISPTTSKSTSKKVLSLQSAGCTHCLRTRCWHFWNSWTKTSTTVSSILLIPHMAHLSSSSRTRMVPSDYVSIFVVSIKSPKRIATLYPSFLISLTPQVRHEFILK